MQLPRLMVPPMPAIQRHHQQRRAATTRSADIGMQRISIGMQLPAIWRQLLAHDGSDNQTPLDPCVHAMRKVAMRGCTAHQRNSCL
jgi:hypothetical protein